MSGFLIQYNRRSREVFVTEFDGPDGPSIALQRRLDLEDIRESGDWEIASLNSDSLETIKQTHARYFENELLSA